MRDGGRHGPDRLRQRPAETPPPDKFLEVEPLALTLNAEGTPVKLTVRARNVTWTAEPADQWVLLNIPTGDGDATIAVSATPNSDIVERQSLLRITADGVAPVQITILQQANKPVPPPEPVVLTHAEGYWDSDYWETGGVLDDLYLVMTDREIRDGTIRGAGSIASLDLNLPAAAFDTFEITGSYAPSRTLPPTVAYTFNADEVTYVATYDDAGNRTAQRYATNGSILVTGTRPAYRIVVDLALDDGTRFLATFEGTVPFFDDTKPVISTLTGDCHPALTTATGTFPVEPESHSSIPLLLDLRGTEGAVQAHLQLLFHVTREAFLLGCVEGIYRIAELPIPPDRPPGTAIPGTVTQSGGDIAFAGSWYLQYADAAAPSGMAPLRTGRVEITRSGEQYGIDFALTDDNAAQPHTVSGRYEGPIEFINLPEPGPGPGDATTGGTLAPWKPGGRW